MPQLWYPEFKMNASNTSSDSEYLERTVSELSVEWLKILGYKATAMRLFRLFGLFPLPVLIFPPNVNIQIIRKGILSPDFSGKKLAIRFSRPTTRPLEQQLNAPRTWITEPEEIIKYIEKVRNESADQESSIVIQPKIDLQYSFELYMQEDGILIELLPGLWGIDNKYPVDRIIARNGSATLQRYTSSRLMRCSYELEFTHRPPLTFETLDTLHRRIISLTPILKLLKKCLLNNAVFHFLADTDLNFYFMNARSYADHPRNSKWYEFDTLPLPSLTVISNPKEIENWDKKTGIALDFATQRENSSELIECIHVLEKVTDTVYIKAGLLSHLAILLREYNLKVKQLVGDEYETRTVISNSIGLQER